MKKVNPPGRGELKDNTSQFISNQKIYVNRKDVVFTTGSTRAVPLGKTMSMLEYVFTV